MRQGLRLEPVLQAISDFLDVQQNVIERVRSDLVRGLKNAATGRSGLTPQQVLRSLVLMRVKNWDYRELRERIADGYTLRQFTDFHSRRVPRHDAFHRGFTRLTPATLKAINELVVAAAAVTSSWRMADSCASIPPWCSRTFIIRPTTRCCGMWCA